MPSRVVSTDLPSVDQLISPTEAQHRLAIGQTTYYLWVKKGWLHPIRFSRRLIRIRAAEVSDLIARIANGEGV